MKKGEFAMRIAEARKNHGLSQAEVCELICIGDVSTISKWENGVVIPSEKMVSRLMKVYQDKVIGYLYLQEHNEIGQQLLPPIRLSGLDNLALNFQYEFEDIDEMRRDVLEIARDGIVDEQEQNRWVRIVERGMNFFSVAYPMWIGNFNRDKKALQDGNLARAHV